MPRRPNRIHPDRLCTPNRGFRHAAQVAGTTGFQARADKLRLEYSPLVAATSPWMRWLRQRGIQPGLERIVAVEARLAGRVDAYLQTGEPEPIGRAGLRRELPAFSRRRPARHRGTQTVIWGRIDEIPPTDRLSVQDLSRFVLDDLQTGGVRGQWSVRGFCDKNKLELLWTPTFRGAELSRRTASGTRSTSARRGAGLPAIPCFGRWCARADRRRRARLGQRLRAALQPHRGGGRLRADRAAGAPVHPYFRYDVARNTLEHVPSACPWAATSA